MINAFNVRQSLGTGVNQLAKGMKSYEIIKIGYNDYAPNVESLVRRKKCAKIVIN